MEGGPARVPEHHLSLWSPSRSASAALPLRHVALKHKAQLGPSGLPAGQQAGGKHTNSPSFTPCLWEGRQQRRVRPCPCCRAPSGTEHFRKHPCQGRKSCRKAELLPSLFSSGRVPGLQQGCSAPDGCHGSQPLACACFQCLSRFSVSQGMWASSSLGTEEAQAQWSLSLCMQQPG